MDEITRSYEPNFITFEGPDKAGKSFQYRLTCERLDQLGLRPVCLREPGGTDVGERIREIVSNPDYEMSPKTELLLYEAARATLLRKTIAPSLERGALVLCDRYANSSLAYQGYGRGLDLDLVCFLNDFATEGIYSGLTLLFLKRVAEGDGTRLEQQGDEFDERVLQGYREIAKSEPDRIKVVGTIIGEPNRTFEEETWPFVAEFLGIS